MPQLLCQQIIPAAPAAVWGFFATPRNLEAMTPPRLRIRILGEIPSRMYAGQLIAYRISPLPGVWMSWLTEIRHVREGRYFVDEQRAGPYRFWYHEHHFEPVPGGVRMTDRVTYEVGWGPVGRWADQCWVRRELEATFAFRRDHVTARFGSA